MAPRKKPRRGLALALAVALLGSCGWLALHLWAVFVGERSIDKPASAETLSFSSVGSARDGARAALPRAQLTFVAAQQNGLLSKTLLSFFFFQFKS